MLTSPISSAPNRRLSEADKRQLTVDLSAGISTAKLASKFGVSQRAIQAFAARLNRDPHARIESSVLGIRLRPDEILAIDQLAERLGSSRSEITRHVLRRASGFFDPEIEFKKSISDLTKELKRIGTNLNQLVYHANRRALLTGKGEISDADLAIIVAMQHQIANLSERTSTLIVNKAVSRRQSVDDILKAFEP